MGTWESVILVPLLMSIVKMYEKGVILKIGTYSWDNLIAAPSSLAILLLTL